MKELKGLKRKGVSDSKKSSDILSQVKPVSETDDFVTALFYGRSGTGKTTIASSFPKPSLLLDFRDRGTDSIKDIKGIDVFNIQKWEELEGIYWSLVKGSKYKSIILDTVNGMQNLAIREVKAEEGQDEEDTLTKRGWGKVSSMMNQWLINYRDLEYHIVFLAPDRLSNASEEAEEVEEGEIEPEIGPALVPSVAKSLNAAVKVIGNTFIKQKVTVDTKSNKQKTITQYRLRIGPNPYYITKIRSPKSFPIPISIPNATFDRIVKIMKGEKDEEK